MTLRRFPDGFLWGAATSSHQVEGGNAGNDWSCFEREGRVARGEVSGEAVDSYHRYEEDFDLAAGMHHSAHRLSLEWSRIEPAAGHFDDAAIEHYVRVLQTLRARGMKCFLTVNHFTLPAWFADAGGWAAPASRGLFARYVSRVAPPLAGLVDAWITVNEPVHLAATGYLRGLWPPRRRGPAAGHAAAVNLAAAHREAYRVLKAVTPETPVGPAVNAYVVHPCEGGATWEDAVLSGPARWLLNDWWLDMVRDRADFIGAQYYMAVAARSLLHARYTERCESEAHSDMGWRIYPEGMREYVARTWRRYRLPIYVTENGIADADDDQRPAFIRDHLASLHRAMVEDGADVRGYLHWSLLDNFEWADGWAPKFGLIEVDRTTMARTPRPSAAYYATICRDNAVDDEADPASVI